LAKPSSDNTLAQLKAGKLHGSKSLKLSCGLTHFPDEIFTLADSLEILDLTGNALSDLPSDLNRLKKLRILFCSSNQFTHLPEVLGKCENLSMIGFKANQISHIAENAIPTKNLRWFIVTDNALQTVPNSLGNCTKLQKLMLAGNELTALPQSITNCHHLELLRISANQFTALPDFLFNLPKLTWLAYAGNPFCNAIEQDLIRQHQINHIDWQTLTIQQVLGEGASGITYQALLQHQGAQELVAVKLFKSAVTSDGLPRCEMHANLLAGDHTNLVGIKGIIKKHPQGVSGMVMPLLAADLNILAQPPSFDSCTRDVYKNDLKLTQTEAQHIINGVTQAAKHLHARGLMHGDLYAHNILWNAEKVVLSDLGGASFLPLNNPDLTQKLLNLEARALAVLAEELQNVSKMEFRS
jgi:Protein kinase domain/Leucine rich repeat